MFNLSEITRKNIRDLKPYSSARDEFSGQANIFLDANENSFGSPLKEQFNRYPDPHQSALKQAISREKNISVKNIFAGNGSDECIDLLYRCFCEPGRDNVIVCPPTYGMYEVSAAVNDVSVKKVPLTGDFQLDLKGIEGVIDKQTKIIWFCSPNNPTGNPLSQNDIEKILAGFNGLVVIDEAYIDFSDQTSFLTVLPRYPNLIVLQTFSKAWGMAGLRLGMCFASEEIVTLLDKVKPPYNINQFTQEYAIKALANSYWRKDTAQELVDLRKQLAAQLDSISFVEKVYPSDANFLLVKMKDAKQVYRSLLDKGIVTRDRSNVVLCSDCLRITVGTAIENSILVETLKGNDPRIAQRKRETTETKIELQVNLDGSGLASIHTGLNFFDHMLEQIARHGRIDLFVRATGDLQVDEHHTVEDVGIALGEAFAKALRDKRGIERYGFALPMDDAEAKVLIDFGGRSWIVWHADFKREKIGDVPVEMFFHFFKSFSDAAKCNLNIECRGDNEHHKIEAIFKAFAKAMRMAVKKDPLSNYLPTTKGTI